MAFFTPKDVFTHQGSFYAVPVIYRITDEEFIVAGTNIVTGDLFNVATIFHNYVVESVVQFTTALLGLEYQPGFPFWVSNRPLEK